jgi:hypothetical protein
MDAAGLRSCTAPLVDLCDDRGMAKTIQHMKRVSFAFLLFTSLMAGGCAREAKISSTFPAAGVERVVLRASSASAAKIERLAKGTATVTVTGKATGGAEGYYPSDPDWEETPASEWGMGFVSNQFGPVLVISSKNEIGYIHHYYTIEELTVQLPEGVQLIREPRELSETGEPNLRRP